MSDRKQKELKPAITRVMERVLMIPEAGCWLFMGAINDFGYGIVGLGPRGAGVDRAHRVAYRHFVGDTPAGLVVCHRCDVPSCCNPHHLFLGTHADNHADMDKKGRRSPPPRNLHDIGSRRYNARLTDGDVLSIRSDFDSGRATGAELARQYQHSPAAMYRICKRIMWKHLP